MTAAKVSLQLCRRGLHSSTVLRQSVVPLTKDTYAVRRGDFAVLKDSHIQQFLRILDSQRVITDPVEVESYNVDWFMSLRGCGQVVLRPRTTEEVSAILRICNEERLAVVPQGGNTGVVGGAVPVFDEVIISTTLMNKVIKINDIPGSVVCQAGCVLESLDTALVDHGLMMPLDLGAKGSCHIGGNIATNAGGLRLLRYGSMHANTLGLVAVKADGQVLDCMNTLKKDNTGYHLKHLFIGSEGTLGIVTEVAIQCPPKPKSIAMAFIGLSDFKQALQTFRLARKSLSEILSACEVMDVESLQPVISSLGIRSPLGEYPFYLLIEVSGSNPAHDEEKLNLFLETALSQALISDGLVTSEPSKMNVLWQLRECIPEALFKDCYGYLYDISMSHENFYQVVPELREKLKGTEAHAITGFGHLGDGNLHLNICSPKFSSELLSLIEPFVFEWVSQRGGSISAEHGIGFKKTKFLKYSKSRTAINTMRQIKHLMDPQGILNPYKVLPPD